MSTAVAVVGTAHSDARLRELRDGARWLAAPAALIAQEERVELWKVGARPEADRAVDADVGFENEAGLWRIKDALSPDAVMQAKHDRQRQLSFFDIDVSLLTRARERLGDSLARRVRAAIREAASVHGVEPTVEEAQTAARTVAQAITVLAIRDKMTSSGELDDAFSVFAERFSDGTTQLDRAAVVLAIARIGEQVGFAGLDATVLSDLYENAVLSPETRRLLGAYYTPPRLARRMLAALPVEELDPDDRTVLDLACGSGTLLLASAERLVRSGAPADSSARHQYIVDRLYGVDRDPFAVELTKLALFLHELPHGNGWHVVSGDGLGDDAHCDLQPSIVVGNPPWLSAHEGRSDDLAASFMEAMVSRCAPGGLIAALMPATWIAGSTARHSRAAVAAVAEVFEVWRLNTTIFKRSGAPPSVVLLRKARPPAKRRWLYRAVGPGGTKSFYEGRDDLFPGALGSAVDDPQAPFSVRPHALERALAHFKRLEDVALVRGGAPVNSISEVGSHGGSQQFLSRSTVTPRFGSVSPLDLAPCRYPQDFSKRGRSDPRLFATPKVLVALTNTVGRPDRARAMTDEIGVVPRNSMAAVVPIDNEADARLALTAVLGSRVANAWFQASTSRQIALKYVKDIPVPPQAEWSELAAATLRVQEAYAMRQDAAPEITQLERLVERAYRLDDGASREIATLLGGRLLEELGPAGDGRAASDTGLLTVGSVLAVADDALLLFVAGVTDEAGDWVAPPPRMPGALMHPGATFDVYGAELGLDLARYVPQEMAWRYGDALQPESLAER